MNATELSHLNGQSVLVRSSADHNDPPIALRGTIDAHLKPSGEPEVRIVLEYPDMCNRAAHQGIINVDLLGVDRLAASEHDGVFEYTIDRPLDPPGPEPNFPQAAS